MKARSERSRAKRLHEYARYDAEKLYAILDAMPVAHVSYILEARPS